MAEERKRAAGTSGPEGSPTSLKQDAKSRIQQLAKALGNDEIARRITEGNATRDQMLAFVTERLGIVQELQQRELELTLKNASFNLPYETENRDRGQPTRWHATAEAYEAAVKAICRGDLRRGQELLERAQQVERETLDQMSRAVATGEAWRAGQLDAGVLATLVAQTPTSGSCAEPTDARTRIDAILAVQQTMHELPVHKREHDPWWTVEEEAEEKPDAEP